MFSDLNARLRASSDMLGDSSPVVGSSVDLPARSFDV